MADDDKKPSSTSGEEWYLWLFGGLMVLGLLGGAAGGVSDFLMPESQVVVTEDEIGYDPIVDLGVESGSLDLGARPNSQATATIGFEGWFNRFKDWLATFSLFKSAGWLVMLSMIISALSLVVILYSSLRQHWIMLEWDKEIGYSQAKEDLVATRYYTGPLDKIISKIFGIKIGDHPSEPVVTEVSVSGNPEADNYDTNGDGMITMDEIINPRWEHIKELIESEDEMQWRQAILEADIMLDELLTNLNLQGTTVAEKLQQIRPADMDSLADAWQAHKVRNRVVHEGQMFQLDRDLFLKTMAQFERVFKENFII